MLLAVHCPQGVSRNSWRGADGGVSSVFLKELHVITKVTKYGTLVLFWYHEIVEEGSNTLKPRKAQ